MMLVLLSPVLDRPYPPRQRSSRLPDGVYREKNEGESYAVVGARRARHVRLSLTRTKSLSTPSALTIVPYPRAAPFSAQNCTGTTEKHGHHVVFSQALALEWR